MTYDQLTESLRNAVYQYDHRRFFSDSKYRKEQEPFVQQASREQMRLRMLYSESNPVIPAVDEEHMIRDLLDPKKRASVAVVLDIMPGFSRTLLRAMIKAAIDTHDPSANRIFIEPCTRFFDAFVVNDFVCDFVANGTKEEKIGALRCYYWIRSRVIRFSIGEGPMQEELIEFRWNGKAYTYEDENRKHFSLGAAALNEYKPRVEAMYRKRLEFLLDRLEIESDVEILLALFRELPKTPDDFPGELQEKVKNLFTLNERELVWGVVEPYRKTAGIADETLREKIYQEARVESQKLMKEVQEKIRKNRS